MTTSSDDSGHRAPDPRPGDEERGGVVYTVGHGARPFAAVAAHLLEQGVDLIVDVRSVPASRHAPDFTKTRLTVLAPQHGLGYRWLGDRLGGRPDEPELLRDGVPDWEAVAHSAGFAAGMSELDGLLDAGVVAVLCSELDPANCHRTHLVAPALEQRGHRVRHILADGSVVEHQPALDLDG
jgi:uncharacterized protein (DUF488 family)